MILQSHSSDHTAWTIVAASSRLLALPAADADRIQGLTERMNSDDGFRAALEALLGGGISEAPPFALIDGDRSVLRVVLRGDAWVTVTWTDPDAAELTVSGAGMATWSERVVEGARRLQLQLPGSRWTVELDSMPAALPAPRLPEPPAPVSPEPPAPVSPAPVSPEPAPEPEAYDFLFGDTIYRTHAGVAVHMPNSDPERAGDHDGQTMLAEEIGLRDRLPAASVAAPISELDEATQLSAPQLQLAPLPIEETLAPPAPPLQLAPQLQLERSDGGRESLRQPVLIGRSPSASASPSPEPRLITIADDKDISRSHVRVAVEGDAVVVTDLASKNGTVVTLPGGTPRKLRGGEPTVVLPGTLIDLGGGVTFWVREE